MGVYGLWRLLDATGKQVPLETLEGKVLAIDISIWIHQVLQGYQDHFGNPKPNAHLIGLYFRICKLLHSKIKPIFVFDGGAPLLKKNTVALRRKQKSMAKNKAKQMRTELINNLMKHSTVKTALNPDKQNLTNNSSEIVLKLQNKQTVDDIFMLPDVPSTSKEELNVSDNYDSDSSIELSPRKQTKWIGNIHSVDVTSAEFKALPADVRYDILTDLKETRKQNSWGRLHEMPDESNEFSGFQMKRLLKRRLVQESLESAEKEMGGKTLTLDELDKLLNEQGITTTDRNCVYRIAADNTTRLIYSNNKNAGIKNSNADDSSRDENDVGITNETDKPVTTSSGMVPICEDINEYEFDDEFDSDIETITMNSSKLRPDVGNDSESEVELYESRPLSKKYFDKNMNPALTYMLEYSGLREEQILMLLEQNKREDQKNNKKIAKELRQIDSPEIRNCEDEDNALSVQPSTSMSENNKEFAKLDSTTSNNEQIELTKTIAISSTDSDSDDFIEIEDAPLPNVNSNVSTKASQQSIEITFKAHQKIEDDMFADIFDASNNGLNVEAESKITPPSRDSPEKLISFLNHQETKDIVVSEKPVVELAKDKVQDKQLSDITGMDNTDIEITKSDTNVNCKDIQSEKCETERTNDIKIATDYEKSSIEVSYEEDNTSVNVPIIVDSRKANPIPMNEDELLSLKARLEDEQRELMTNIGKLERQGIDISKRIQVEVQELLRLFGIPYIVAPMEAEAQCAYLEQIHLTDGTITDDSDIWLFGGQCVYKNFFDNNKKILQFRSCDIQHHLKLTRNEMIQLALLVGSDYTTGVTGIGPVTALEVLGVFPSEGDDILQGLTNFCSWIETGKAVGPGRTTLRNKLQNIQIHKGFPSQAVAQAYLFPEVDESKESFTWGKPNILLLSDYTKQKFGWTQTKFDDTMAPVLKKLGEKESQKSIDTYFKVQTVPKSIEPQLSKRVQKAVQRLNNQNSEDFGNIESTQRQEPSKRKKSECSNEKRKKKNVLGSEQNVSDSTKPKAVNISVSDDKSLERIPQREKDKADALKKKLHAIEVHRKSKQGLYKTKKVKRCIRKVKDEAGLSESDSNSS